MGGLLGAEPPPTFREPPPSFSLNKKIQGDSIIDKDTLQEQNIKI